MLIPFFSRRVARRKLVSQRKLVARKGGGAGPGAHPEPAGGGAHPAPAGAHPAPAAGPQPAPASGAHPNPGGGGGGSSGNNSTSSGGSVSDLPGNTPGLTAGINTKINYPISVSGSRMTATSYGDGYNKTSLIPSGSLFAGRQEGGASRTDVYGTSAYGSGYPGVSGRGVTNLGFPFFFWPIVWGSGASVASYSYLDGSEYGTPDNSSRPGGPMTQTMFVSVNPNFNMTFNVISDNTTTLALINSVNASCLIAYNSSYTSVPVDPNQLFPEQAVQYYRASSIVLTLSGYNNSGALSNDQGAPDTPLPDSADSTLLYCINQTIGASAPLVGTSRSWAAASPPTMGLLWVVLFFISMLM